MISCRTAAHRVGDFEYDLGGRASTDRMIGLVQVSRRAIVLETVACDRIASVDFNPGSIMDRVIWNI